jgi:hypothetical protein
MVTFCHMVSADTHGCKAPGDLDCGRGTAITGTMPLFYYTPVCVVLRSPSNCRLLLLLLQPLLVLVNAVSPNCISPDVHFATSGRKRSMGHTPEGAAGPEAVDRVAVRRSARHCQIVSAPIVSAPDCSIRSALDKPLVCHAQ